MNILALDMGKYKKTKKGEIIQLFKNCSKPCIKAICPTCGKEFFARSRRRKTNHKNHQIFCSRECFYKNENYKPPIKKGEKNNNWKGGISESRGYLIHTAGEHTNKAIHRLIAEKALGRKLKRTETVHHIDGDKQNNKNNNLLICSNSYHQWLSAKMALQYQIDNFRERIL